MESSAALTLSQLPYLFPPKSNRRRAYPSWPCKPRSSQPTRLHCHKMYVPGFGEASPEAKAANNLHSFFTYIAVRIVAAQLQVRSAYCKNDFEWDNLKRLAVKMVNESNTRLMREYVLETSLAESEK
ncbi:hypothetical protein CJ030_MR0G003141 [Morella rubra]|uniref:Chaperonin-like RBCX protein 1, chloroplastic n=1 Tax=Morella rubra TaxID=262757 RepID=A0A6A1UMW8_9ROSI|nr:hypothetical protein CJ030_MR0G003141 [Morella rubra]